MLTTCLTQIHVWAEAAIWIRFWFWIWICETISKNNLETLFMATKTKIKVATPQHLPDRHISNSPNTQPAAAVRIEIVALLRKTSGNKGLKFEDSSVLWKNVRR